MSAFLVSDTLINSLLHFAKKNQVYIYGKRHYDLSNEKDLQKVGQILLDANYKSVNARYGEKSKSHKYHFSFVSTEKITPAQILKSCDCLDYQSCEFTGWNKSEAKNILDRIFKHAARNGVNDAYESAKWGI